MKNSADLVGCYPPRPSASVDNTLLDLQNSSYPVAAISFFLFVSFFVPYVNVFCHIPHAFSLAYYLHFVRYIFVILSCSFSVSLSFVFFWFPEPDFQHLEFIFFTKESH